MYHVAKISSFLPIYHFILYSPSYSHANQPLRRVKSEESTPMKISKVTPMTMGTEWRNITFVKVETDEGLVGIADSRVINRTEAVIGYLKEAVPRYVLGSDPFNIEQLVNRMYLEDY